MQRETSVPSGAGEGETRRPPLGLKDVECVLRDRTGGGLASTRVGQGRVHLI